LPAKDRGDFFEADAPVRVWRLWHWVPIPLFLLLLFALSIGGPDKPYVSPPLLLLLNFTFSTLISLFIAVLLGRNFVARGDPFLLLLGCGVLAWGATGTLSTIADPESINANVAIYNGGALLAALCNFAGALLTLWSRRPMRIPTVWAAAAYTLAIAAVVMLARAAAVDMLPVFFVQGVGGTPVRQAVLGSAVIMFVAAALILRYARRRALSKFLHWYSLALLLIATGLTGVLEQSSYGSALNWASRAAQYAGSLYMMVAALVSWRDFERSDHAFQTALTEVRQRYEGLFDLATDGIVVHNFDSEPMAGRFTEANAAFCDLLGYSLEEIRGLSPRDVTSLDESATLQRHLERTVIQRDGLLRHDEVLVARDGRHIPVEMNSRLFRQGGRYMILSVIRDITERKRVEQERERMIARLNDERALLDMVVNNASEGINLVRADDLRYVLVNPAYQAMFPGREILGRTLGEVWPEVPGLEDIFRRVLETGHPHRGVEQVFQIRRSLDGQLEERCFNWTVTPVRLPGAGGGWTLLNAVSDVTEHVRARREIAATNERLSRVLASITEGYYAVDAEWRILEMNAVAEAHFGGGNLRGQNIWLLTHTPPSAPLRQAFHTAAANGRPAHFEAESRVRGGRWFELHLYPRDGRLEVYFHDTTERKRAVEAVAESERRYRGLFESMQEGFLLAELVLDADNRPKDHRYLEVNTACEAVLGRKREEVAGRTHGELFAGTEWDAWTSLFAPVVLTGEPARLELQGRGRHYQAFAYCPHPARFAVLFTDITERKQAEERLRQTQKLESIGLLAGGIAHDFNNLLVGVMGNASLARDAVGPDHPAIVLLDRVQECAEHAADLTRQMLAYSGKGRFVIEPLDLSAQVSAIAGLVQPSISKKVRVEFSLAEGLPPVEADRGQIQQVIMNLLLNASEALGEGPGVLSVRTAEEELDPRGRRFDVAPPDISAGRYLLLEVRDTGCGMDEETRARIFDPFFTTKFTGRGLGLAAVAGIIRGHNGAMEVSSTPGRGSCFTAWFPAGRSRRAAAPETTLAAPAARPRPTVLVVDDDPMVRDIARRALEYSGMPVLTAAGGGEALEMLCRESGIGLVVLDFGEPGLGGEETLDRLRQIRPGIPVVACSGYREDETRRFFEGHRIDGFVQKPYSAPQLVQSVRDALGAVT
jgi:PAS domain S-box-containing protein